MGDERTHQSEVKSARGKPITDRRALDSLNFGSRTTGEQALARSRRIKNLRMALPMVALLLAVIFFFSTKSNTVDDAFLKDFENMSAAAEELKMASPRFTGVDEQGRPFEITAAAATQIANNQEIVKLVKPRAVQGEGEKSTTVTADKGLYQSEANVLELEENVTLSHDLVGDVFVLRSPAATVSIKDEIVTSNAGVNGEGTDGSSLEADNMVAYNGEGRVVFEGNVRMRIYPKSRDKDSETEGITDPDATQEKQQNENDEGTSN